MFPANVDVKIVFLSNKIDLVVYVRFTFVYGKKKVETINVRLCTRECCTNATSTRTCYAVRIVVWIREIHVHRRSTLGQIYRLPILRNKKTVLYHHCAHMFGYRQLFMCTELQVHYQKSWHYLII